MPPRKKQDGNLTDYVALGDILHGPAGVEGPPIEIPAGEFLPAGKFSDEEIQGLLDLEAIAHKDEFGRHPLDEQIVAARAELDAREAELEQREADLAAKASGAAQAE